MIEDLVNLEPDFMDKHRAVITSSGPKNVQPGPTKGSGSFGNKVAGSALRKSMNSDLQNLQSQAQAQTRGTTKKQTTFQEPPARVNRQTQPANQARNRNKFQAEQSPGGMNEVVKGQPETMPPEALTISRPKPKTKAERRGDCSSKKQYTAEELRLNPLLALGDDEEEKKGPPSKGKQLA